MQRIGIRIDLELEGDRLNENVFCIFESYKHESVCALMLEYRIIKNCRLLNVNILCLSNQPFVSPWVGSSLQDGSLFSLIGIFHYKFIKFISLKLIFGSAQLMKVSVRCQ